MSLVAKRYSEAFFSLALDKNKVSEYKEDLKLVLDTFKGVDSIDLFFASEKITKQEKKDLIEKSFNEKISVDAKNLLKLLMQISGFCGRKVWIFVPFLWIFFTK